MMMISRNFSTPSTWTRTYADGSVQNIVRAGFAEVFSCAPGGKGDHVTPTNHYFQKTVSRAQKGWAVHRNSYPPFSWSGTGPIELATSLPDWTVPVAYETAVYNEALSRLNDAVRGSLDLSIDAFQGRQTKQMLAAAFNVVEYARQLRKGWVSGRFGRTKTFANLWLEYTYGWKPLVGTVYDLAKELFDPEAFLCRYSGTAKQKWNFETNAPGFMNINQKCIYDVSLRCKLGVALQPPTKTSADVSRFSSLNPASIAWELLPYSFVVDWFYDLGGYLRNAETGMIYGSTFKYGYKTITEKTSSDRLTIGTNSSAGNVTTGEFKGGWVRTRLTRTRLQSFPMPRVPVLNVSLGSSRLTSAASLLAQFLGRR